MQGVFVCVCGETFADEVLKIHGPSQTPMLPLRIVSRRFPRSHLDLVVVEPRIDQRNFQADSRGRSWNLCSCIQ